MTDSRISGFYKLTVEERRAALAMALGEHQLPEDAQGIWKSGGLATEAADQIVENVVGVYSLPFGVALNATINGSDRLIPMVVEEPSVIAAASNACRMIRAGGGFTATMDEALMIAQVELRELPDLARGCAALEDSQDELFEMAREALIGLVRRGGGPRGWELRPIGPGHLVVHLLVDCRDAMGANLVNTAAEALGPRMAEITGGKLGLQILSNLSDRRMVRVTASVPGETLVSAQSGLSAEEVLDAIEAASKPHRSLPSVIRIVPRRTTRAS